MLICGTNVQLKHKEWNVPMKDHIQQLKRVQWYLKAFKSLEKNVLTFNLLSFTIDSWASFLYHNQRENVESSLKSHRNPNYQTKEQPCTLQTTIDECVSKWVWKNAKRQKQLKYDAFSIFSRNPFSDIFFYVLWVSCFHFSQFL